jgi:uncharacterized LabA/DUF88 family protein
VTQQTLTTLEVRVEAVAVEEAKPVLPTSLIFVDGTHVDHRCYESFGRVDIDFGKFFAKLAEGTQLLGAVYCTAPYLFDHLRRHQKGVLNRLKQMRVKIYEGRHMNRKFKCRKCKHLHSEPVEKGTDVAVASHLVQAACLKQADRLILVAGDNDYWPALHIAKQVGAHCRFAYFVGPDESDQKVFNEVVMFAEQQQRIYQARPRLHE